MHVTLWRQKIKPKKRFCQILAWCRIFKNVIKVLVFESPNFYIISSQKMVSAPNYFVGDGQSWSILSSFIKCYEKVIIWNVMALCN